MICILSDIEKYSVNGMGSPLLVACKVFSKILTDIPRRDLWIAHKSGQPFSVYNIQWECKLLDKLVWGFNFLNFITYYMLHCIEIFTNTCEFTMQVKTWHTCREDYNTQNTCTNILRIHVLMLSLHIILLALYICHILGTHTHRNAVKCSIDFFLS